MTKFDSRIVEQDFGRARPRQVRVLLAQGTTNPADWDVESNLWIPHSSSALDRWIKNVIIRASQHAADLVVFPELSVPASSIPPLQAWSKETGACIVGGSHYSHTPKGRISRCPVIIAGEVLFTEKQVPAPSELSPIEGESLLSGERLYVFKRSPIGDFAVLICSDYLDPNLRREIIERRLDFVCVPAFQRQSEMYHQRMNIDCDESSAGLYLAYVNMHCGNVADGRSAFFGVLDNLYAGRLIDTGITDGVPSRKLCELSRDADFVVMDVDIDSKRPSVPRTVSTRPNVIFVKADQARATTQTRFLTQIAHDDERYANIASLFVPPAEYQTIVAKLEAAKLVFIVGDPGIGKTYTAAMLLRHYFDRGYEPVWFTGLEKEERLIQRKVLQDFRPKARQVVYFEDPFGRTVFERRDAIFQVFGPLSDTLQDLDARVIVTSRREVFERFAKESLTARELAQFKEELSVVKPSYTPTALLTILENIAREKCEWYQNAEARAVVEDAIRFGHVATPFAIRDLAYSTEKIVSTTVLRSRIARRERETALSFAQEVQSCHVSQKLALLLVYLFGSKDQSRLVNWYAEVISAAARDETYGPSTFMEVVREQLGYRVEKYGATRTGFRFSHPVYEEAFVEAALQDPVIEELGAVLMSRAAVAGYSEIVDSILRYVIKHTDFTLRLFNQFVDAIESRVKSFDVWPSGAQLIGAFDKTKNTGVLDLFDRLIPSAQLLDVINSGFKVPRLALALRLVSNRELRTPGGDPRRLDSSIDWPSLGARLVRTSSSGFEDLLHTLEWAATIRPSFPDEFFRDTSIVTLLGRYKSIPGNARERVNKLVSSAQVRASLENLLGASHYGGWLAVRHEVARRANSAVSRVLVDNGAAKAVSSKRCALLPAGVVGVVGEFIEGDTVAIADELGEVVAFGLAEYNASEVIDLRGRHSSLIAEVIGRYHGAAIVRRDAMVWTNDLDDVGVSPDVR